VIERLHRASVRTCWGQKGVASVLLATGSGHFVQQATKVGYAANLEGPRPGRHPLHRLVEQMKTAVDLYDGR
jgi:hypothetical protein